MKTVKIDDFIHLVTYSCNNITLCNKKVSLSTSFIERKSLWEATCPKCKKYVVSAVNGSKSLGFSHA